MATVNTVLGPVDAKALGFTLMHEHLIASSAGIPHTFPELVDRKEAIAGGVKALKEAAAEGLGTYVDVTTMGLGRDVTVLRAVAEQVGVHIIAATGIWLDIPRAIANSLTADQLAQLFVREIEVGIEGTGIKAGVIKVATAQEGVTPANEVVLRAAARASNFTGVPITTHTVATARVGEAQMAIFLEERVDPRRVCIGHSNDTTDVDYLAGLARQGCVLGMDHYPGGRGGSLNWEERTQVVKRLVDMGLADRVSFSHDYLIARLASPEVNEQQRASNPDGICFVSRRVLPRLRELGVSEAAIRAMTVEAPRRFFGGSRHPDAASGCTHAGEDSVGGSLQALANVVAMGSIASHPRVGFPTHPELRSAGQALHPHSRESLAARSGCSAVASLLDVWVYFPCHADRWTYSRSHLHRHRLHAAPAHQH